jgi:predicted MFS family arabinose efflux permease
MTTRMTTRTTTRPAPGTLTAAFALSLGAAISLGLARFSYALLLPAMRADLGWTYLTAGSMNTANALGYLVGAVAMPQALARLDARRLLLLGAAGTTALLVAHGLVRGEAALYTLRFLAGVSSAVMFVAGGLLAARLGEAPGAKPALVLGLYYGGTGGGIFVSALLVPMLPWSVAWIALAAASGVAGGVMAVGTRALAGARSGRSAHGSAFRARDFAWGLAGYLMFGLGYIGYMTFIVTLLRAQGMSSAVVVAFYALLGLGVLASPWLWARLLHRHRGGQALATLNALLAAATALAVLSAHPVAVFVSGAMFGAVFLSVVASTTALVRHNLPMASWSSGITAFTVVFAAGQIVGPSLVGWVADGPGGLRRGLAMSAVALLAGAAMASRQRALPVAPAA